MNFYPNAALMAQAHIRLRFVLMVVQRIENELGKTRTDGSEPVDASGNWWGAADPAAVAASIRDAGDRKEAGPVKADCPLLQPLSWVSPVTAAGP